jgi:dTDP-4-amino-4,6-dideoxygalactose transaminase
MNGIRLRALHRVTVIEDCAQSIGAQFEGVPTGTAGRIAATSFYPTKNLGAMGDAGALLCSTAEDAALARQLRDYGQSAKYVHSSLGWNSRLDELQAMLLSGVFLPCLPQWTDTRRRIAATYRQRLSHPAVTVPGSPPGSESTWHIFPLLVPAGRKPDFLEWLRNSGIAASEHYPALIPDQPAMSGVPHEIVGDLPNARRYATGEVSIPIHPFLTAEEIARVIAAVNSWPD